MGARPAALAVVAAFLLFWALSMPTLGQDPAGHLVVATDYELFGTSDLRGGGHVTWTLTGATAADFRSKIRYMFDEYPIVPRGYLFDGGTNANRDGRLDASEGVGYTNRLEALLEASGRGTRGQYLQLYPFDLRQKDPNEAVGFDRSTSGLAGTDANATGPVEIRFLFEANITANDARFPLATDALAQGLYAGFAYDAVQSPALAPSGPYPGSWPFLVEGGWQIVTAYGRAALWAGNNITGQYDPNTNASTSTSADPGIASPEYVPFDLRFATSAWASFAYTGQVADAGDSLRLEVAHYPTYADWSPLSLGTGLELASTAPGIWSNATVDLASVLGQRIRLRLHFQSDALGTASGFYIRDFALHAPAAYAGTVVESDTHYLIGPVSFSDPEVSAGGIHVIRTPGGDILTYGATWRGSSVPQDAMRFRTFDLTENPQILFGVMLVAAYTISRLQEASYDRYREAHAAVYRPALHRTKWLHGAGKGAMAVLILFYFVPTALGVLGVRAFVSGPAYWFLALSLALLLGFGTRAYYRQKLEETPPPAGGEEPVVVRKVLVGPPVPGEPAPVAHCTHCLREVREGDKTYRCTCGAVYHLNCASGLMRCPNCRKPIAVGVVREKPQISMRCESCGEVQTLPEGTDPRAVTCPNCGGRLRHLDEGKRYLIVASHPAIAFAWMRDLTKGGRPALCLTSASPERLRLEFGVKDVPIVQVASRGGDAIEPAKLDPVGLKAILPLAREGKGGVILYDGLEQIITESSLGDVIRFLRKANDMAFVHGVTVIARVAPGRLTDAELKRLNAEFDEFMDLSAQF